MTMAHIPIMATGTDTLSYCLAPRLGIDRNIRTSTVMARFAHTALCLREKRSDG